MLKASDRGRNCFCPGPGAGTEAAAGGAGVHDHVGQLAAVGWTVKGGGCDDGSVWVLWEHWGSGEASSSWSGAVWAEQQVWGRHGCRARQGLLDALKTWKETHVARTWRARGERRGLVSHGHKPGLKPKCNRKPSKGFML